MKEYEPKFVDMKNVYCADYETELMGPKCLNPRGICLSIATMDVVTEVDPDTGDEIDRSTVNTALVADGDDHWVEYLKGLFDAALEDPEMIVVFHNAKFDLHVFVSDNPDYYSKVCKLYDQGQIQCTILIAKLLNLSTTGWVDKEPIDSDDEEGKGRRIEYSLAKLVLEYLGKDITMDKDKEDSVRTRYQELSGLKAKYYPKEFKDYAINDSEYLIRIYWMMQQKRKHIWNTLGIDPLRTLTHRCSLDFHLARFSIEGVRTNPKQIKVIEDMLEVELSYEKLNLLYPKEALTQEQLNDDLRAADHYLKVDLEESFLRPFVPERTSYRWSHKKNCTKVDCDSQCFPKVSKKHVEDCKKKSDKFTREWLCDCPNSTVQFKKEKMNTKVLKKYILDLWYETPKAYDLLFGKATYLKFGNGYVNEQMYDWDKFKAGKATKDEAYAAVLNNLSSISTKREWLDVYSFKDPILAQFDHRASLVKLKTTEIPRMKNYDGTIAEVVHGNFDVLKETGRTSGYASKLYPSANLQNVHKMARTCFKARTGHWILSTDYSGLEFLSAAQRALNLLGESIYAKVINNGWDSHSYLAAQRAVRSEPWFKEEIDGKGISLSDYESVYHEFMKYKKNDKQLGFYEGKVDDQGDPVPKKFWKHYRNSAKPIGLGLLGGMGAKTIAHVSAAQHKIDMTEDEAKEYKKIWEEIFYPEAQLLKLVNQDMKDPLFSTRRKDKFRYETPMGMVRPNCSYAACANGSILQSPSAEGATLAVINVAKACYDPASTSVLKDNFKPWNFVHDEILGDVIADPVIATKVAKELEKIMCDALKVVFPDLTPNADSALMITWSKEADEFYNRDGLMVPWEVTADEKLAKELNYEAVVR